MRKKTAPKEKLPSTSAWMSTRLSTAWLRRLRMKAVIRKQKTTKPRMRCRMSRICQSSRNLSRSLVYTASKSAYCRMALAPAPGPSAASAFSTSFTSVDALEAAVSEAAAALEARAGSCLSS